MNHECEYSFEKHYMLKAHTPLIHFQHNQAGATLRASEVKPKLDDFLKSKLTSVKPPSEWLVGKGESEHGALDYKLHFTAMDKHTKVALGFGTPYDIFYGNMGKNTYMGVQGDISMTVICTIPNLRDLIDRYIGEFFAVTNFGTMQNKGFGSYTVAGKTDTSPDGISKALKEAYGAEKCYTFNGGAKPFELIKTVYSIMKSGVNFRGYQRSLLFLFMHEEEFKIGNEKAWLKENGFVPTDVGNNSDKWHRSSSHTSHYVRALMGVGDHMDFLNSLSNKKDKTQIKIKSDTIQRLSSPIFFKVIDNNVYYIAQRIDDAIYGSEFEFRKNNQLLGTLSVPTKQQLGENFIDRFLEYCLSKFKNGALKNSPIAKNLVIKEV